MGPQGPSLSSFGPQLAGGGEQVVFADHGQDTEIQLVGYEQSYPMAEEYLTSFDRAIFYSPLIFQYVRDNMMPYITGKDSYEKCLGKLLNALELYKDE